MKDVGRRRALVIYATDGAVKPAIQKDHLGDAVRLATGRAASPL